MLERENGLESIHSNQFFYVHRPQLLIQSKRGILCVLCFLFAFESFEHPKESSVPGCNVKFDFNNLTGAQSIPMFLIRYY